jgi:hypothetical protein
VSLLFYFFLIPLFLAAYFNHKAVKNIKPEFESKKERFYFMSCLFINKIHLTDKGYKYKLLYLTSVGISMIYIITFAFIS